MSDFGFESTTDEVLEGKDLTGKTVFITGGNSGLGRESARAMAAKGAHVVIAGRDQAKLDEAAAEIKSETGNNAIETFLVDLASLDSVRAAGKTANERFQKIDILLNNAGVMACPQDTTADGFERQFGTNHLGHFVLTKGLMPLIEKGEDKRIVNLSSRGHHIDQVHFDDPNFDNREYDKWNSYGQAKTANVLFSVGLEDRFSDKGVHAYAVHPGGIQTNLGRHLSEEDIANLRKRMESNAGSGGMTFKTIPQGAATQVWAATADELEGRGGIYCEDCHVAEVDDENPSGGVRSYAVDKGNADRLWALSEQMTGETFSA
ncbi:NAD(P)-dependent dehydrogenase, short-chain alcohol dehydrogenase family [Altererythrobacter xiamenensis]|uniref:Probable oxidoreductase n=1 Tax=Altererythrobacter xiamenensis TaxID=1316679 RepID=A0A1Y6FAY1_9SPHN|nr:SDR family NAD(P)-dependent oxidoreductase [Altererythrobacter xiamenensis]SMQ69573.1 NAD(P)-dependent dehydrogenase, short-chain alcohol dehydrogenase family [Altererythrobacter xiamenensis]